MGEIVFLCSLCGATLKAPASRAGKMATCPTCRATTQVPEADAPIMEPLPAHADAPPPPEVMPREHNGNMQVPALQADRPPGGRGGSGRGG